MNTLTKTGFTPAALLLMLMQGGDSFAGGVHMFTERAPSAQEPRGWTGATGTRSAQS